MTGLTPDYSEGARVLHICIIEHLKHPISEPFAGGLEMHTHLLASKLVERGYDITVFAADGSTAPGTVAVCPPTAAVTPIAAVYQICDAKQHRAYLRIMEQLRAKLFDVIQKNSLHFLPLAMDGLIDAPVVRPLPVFPGNPADTGWSYFATPN